MIARAARAATASIVPRLPVAIVARGMAGPAAPPAQNEPVVPANRALTVVDESLVASVSARKKTGTLSARLRARKGNRELDHLAIFQQGLFRWFAPAFVTPLARDQNKCMRFSIKRRTVYFVLRCSGRFAPVVCRNQCLLWWATRFVVPVVPPQRCQTTKSTALARPGL